MEEKTGKPERPESCLSLKGENVAKTSKNTYNKHTRLTDETKDGARKKELIIIWDNFTDFTLLFFPLNCSKDLDRSFGRNDYKSIFCLFVCLFFVLFCFVLFCFVLFCFALFWFVLFCFVLFCFVLFCFVLFCFVFVVVVNSMSCLVTMNIWMFCERVNKY